MLRLPDDWVWDSWVADDGETYHLYFLKAPRALEDPSRRHARAVIGHATSTDLVDWTDRGTTLLPSEAGWDDLALWTGSTVRADDGTWRMFYTALNTHRGHVLRDQRVGVVESDDLHHWRRTTDAPALSADGRWYKTLDEDPSASETWRDPFVFRDPGGDGWHMLVTARLKGTERYDDGVLAHARSQDLVSWEVQPPVSGDPSGFGQIEVPQVRVVDGRPVLCSPATPRSRARPARPTTATGAPGRSSASRAARCSGRGTCRGRCRSGPSRPCSPPRSCSAATGPGCWSGSATRSRRASSPSRSSTPSRCPSTATGCRRSDPVPRVVRDEMVVRRP